MRTVFFVSDSTGITAQTLGRSVMTQFEGLDYRHVNLPFVDNLDDARATAGLIDRVGDEDGARPIVFATLTDPKLLEVLAGSNALVLDIFSAFIGPLERELHQHSMHVKGRQHGLISKTSYDKRIGAINFALEEDDGASTKRYHEADVILVGVSRTGKTPVCLYLAMQCGLYAANYPLTEEDLEHKRLPRPLHAHRNRLYGLTIDSERLHKIRSERRPNSGYAALARCREEIIQAEEVFERERIPFMNTTAVSIEEIATRIQTDLALKRRIV
jgi:hypothetical protein